MLKQKKEKHIKTNKKLKNNKKNIPQKRILKKRNILLILLTLLILGIIFLSFKVHNFKTLAKEMFNNTPTTVYDTNKNTIAQIGIERNRKNIKITDVPATLKNAYISIEDKNFYKHHGVDLKRTGAAIMSYILKRGSASFGGSTITQQLAKNLTGDDSNSISRKVKEWFYACTLEACFSKDEILEAYFNIIYTGPNIYGIGEAANYYFNTELNNLSLAQYAFLAGINNAPNSYNPFSEKDRTEKINKRTKTVLSQMLKFEYITKEDYDIAVSEVDNGLNFNKGAIENNTSSIYSYHTDALINEVIADLSKRKHITKDFATNFLYLSGSSIYSTQNSDIQNKVETDFKNPKYILKSSDAKSTSQAAMVIMDHSTGYVVACCGGLGEKKTSRTFNRATQMVRQTGSAMKPIAVLAPAITKKIITNVTVFSDEPTEFIDYNNKPYSPVNYDGYKGSITLRQAVESSQNIPFVKIMEQLTAQTSVQYLKKMGISTLNENDVNLSLSLGGLDEGISPLEFSGAYATIANDGVYIEPTFYTKITTLNNSCLLESKQKSRRVLSKDVSCILKQLLTQPVIGNSGTAQYCKISSIDVAAKTGTTDDNFDRWLCGFTPYYTAVCWYGYDINESINFNGKNPAGLLWASVIKNIHSELPNARFEISKGVVKASICRASGKLANSSCNDIYEEYFLKDTVPETCTQHSESNTNKAKNTTNNKSKTNTTKYTNEDKNTTSPTNSENTLTVYSNTTNTTTEQDKKQTQEKKNTTSVNTNSSLEQNTNSSTNSKNTTSSGNNNTSSVINTTTNSRKYFII